MSDLVIVESPAKAKTIEKLKENLNNLCYELGLDNEVVLKASQHLDRYIVEEQRKKLNEIKGN